MTGLASILYLGKDGRTHIKKVSLETALATYNALTGITPAEEISDKQSDFLLTVRRVMLPPAHRPAGYDPAYGYREYAGKQTTLTHEGIEQGRNQAMPTGDM